MTKDEVVQKLLQYIAPYSDKKEVEIEIYFFSDASVADMKIVGKEAECVIGQRFIVKILNAFIFEQRDILNILKQQFPSQSWRIQRGLSALPAIINYKL